MRQPSIGKVTFVFLLVALGGCVPAKYVAVPAMRGRVVDQDGRPVENAVIQVIKNKSDEVVGSVHTGKDGTFKRPEDSKVILQFAGADRTLTTYSVNASLGERKAPTTQVTDDVRRWFIVFYDPPTDRDLGDLELP